MNFLSLVFFLVLTIGIHNVHAEWKDEKGPLHDCMVNFFVRMYDYSVELKYSNGSKVEKNKSLTEQGFSVGYPESFDTYNDFNTKTQNTLTKVLELFKKVPFSDSRSNHIVMSIRNFVKNLAACINNNPTLSNYHNLLNMPDIKDMLYNFYYQNLLIKQERIRRPQVFNTDCQTTVDPFAGAGTSSSQSSNQAGAEWVITDDRGFLEVRPKQ